VSKDQWHGEHARTQQQIEEKCQPNLLTNHFVVNRLGHTQYGIAARADLNDPKGVYPFYDFTFRAAGAIDAKMTSVSLARSMQ